MGTVTEVKTGTDFTARLDLIIEDEIVTNLPQIFIEFYYVDRGRRNIGFSYFAKDLTDPPVVARAAELMVTVRQMLFDGEIIVCNIPEVDTDKLKIEQGKIVEVFADISYRDSAGKVGKFVEKVLDECGKPILDECGNQLTCDKFVVNMCKAVTENWLVT